MVKHGLSEADAAARFWVLDKDGLVSKSRPGITSLVEHFARPADEADFPEGASLLDVVTKA